MDRDLAKIAQRLGNSRILVLGDLILDRYTWGDAGRVSPEAPVLVLEADTEEDRLGGAASVALLAKGLGAEVAAAGIIGDDPDGPVVCRLLDKAEISRELVLRDPARPTTVKERFIGRAAGRHPHQILRVDHEVRRPIDAELEQHLAESIVTRLGEYQALLVSDYSKGVCTPRLLGAVISAAVRARVPVIIDPARISDYSRYRNATVLTPNRSEAELATGQKIATPDAALAAGGQLCRKCRAEAVLVTLDSQGIALIRADGSTEWIPTRPRSVYDVTGAGDMVLAMIGVCRAAKVPLAETVRLANAAAGLEVEKLGVAPVRRDEILELLESVSP